MADLALCRCSTCWSSLPRCSRWLDRLCLAFVCAVLVHLSQRAVLAEDPYAIKRVISQTPVTVPITAGAFAYWAGTPGQKMHWAQDPATGKHYVVFGTRTQAGAGWADVVLCDNSLIACFSSRQNISLWLGELDRFEFHLVADTETGTTIRIYGGTGLASPSTDLYGQICPPSYTSITACSSSQTRLPEAVAIRDSALTTYSNTHVLFNGQDPDNLPVYLFVQSLERVFLHRLDRSFAASTVRSVQIQDATITASLIALSAIELDSANKVIFVLYPKPSNPKYGMLMRMDVTGSNTAVLDLQKAHTCPCNSPLVCTGGPPTSLDMALDPVNRRVLIVYAAGTPDEAMPSIWLMQCSYAEGAMFVETACTDLKMSRFDSNDNTYLGLLYIVVHPESNLLLISWADIAPANDIGVFACDLAAAAAAPSTASLTRRGFTPPGGVLVTFCTQRKFFSSTTGWVAPGPQISAIALSIDPSTSRLVALAGITPQSSPNNAYTRHLVQFACQPGQFSTGVQSADASVLDCQPCAPGTFSTQVDVSACEPCPAGRVGPSTGLSSNCSDCPVGTYNELLGQAYANVSCLACPAHSTTPGTGVAAKTGCVSLPGFMPSPDDPFVFLQCAHEQACPGNSQCGRGYEGRLCSVCKEGFFRRGSFCPKCPTNAALRILILFAGALFLVLLALIVSYKLTTSAQFKAHKKRWSEHIGMIGILLGFIQLLAVMGSMKVNWPPAVQDVFTAISALNADLSLVAPECQGGGSSGYRVDYELKLYVTVVFPVLFAILLVLVLLSTRALHHLIPSIVPSIPTRVLISASVLITTLLYVSIITKCLAVFDCTLQEDGARTMDIEPSHKCFESASWYRMFGVVLVALVLYGLVLPGLLLTVLIRHYSELENTESETFLIFGPLFSKFGTFMCSCTIRVGS